jgi:hypothetical protein
MASKYTYILTHNHKHGTDCHRFTSQRPFSQLPEAPVVALVLGIDYEPDDYGIEWVEITQDGDVLDFDKLLLSSN